MQSTMLMLNAGSCLLPPAQEGQQSAFNCRHFLVLTDTISFSMQEFCEEAKVRIQRAADSMANRLVVELETGGNVRFEEGSASDVW